MLFPLGLPGTTLPHLQALTRGEVWVFFSFVFFSFFFFLFFSFFFLLHNKKTLFGNTCWHSLALIGTDWTSLACLLVCLLFLLPCLGYGRTDSRGDGGYNRAPRYDNERRNDDRGGFSNRGGYADRGNDRGGQSDRYSDRRTDSRDGGERQERSRDLYEHRGFQIDRNANPAKSEFPTQAPFKAYIGNIPFKITEDEIHDLFSGLKILEIKIPRDSEGRMKGFGYIEFDTLEALKEGEDPKTKTAKQTNKADPFFFLFSFCSSAVTMNGAIIHDRAVRVDLAEAEKCTLFLLLLFLCFLCGS